MLEKEASEVLQEHFDNIENIGSMLGSGCWTTQTFCNWLCFVHLCLQDQQQQQLQPQQQQVILFNNKPAFLETPTLFQHPGKISHKPQIGYSCSYTPTASMLLPCVGVYTLSYTLCSQLRFFQDNPSQKHALCHIVPSLGRLLKGKQLSGHHSNQHAHCVHRHLLIGQAGMYGAHHPRTVQTHHAP